MPTLEEIQKQLSTVDMGREYVAGGVGWSHRPFSNERLAKTIDDIEREVDVDAYEKMMNDPAVSSCVNILKRLILSNPVRIEPAVTDPEDPLYAKAGEIAEFVKAQITNRWARRPFVSVLEELLDALWKGSAIAEVTLRYAKAGKWKGNLVLDSVKPKSLKRVSYYVDEFHNVLGIVADNSSVNYQTSDLPRVDGLPIMPREKFLILSLWGRGGDVRGKSLLRSAYTAWYFRQQEYEPWLKFLWQWANPSLIGKTPENSELISPELDSSGNQVTNDDGTPKLKTPEAVMKEALESFQGGSVVVLKGGSELDKIQSDGTGEAFTLAFDEMRREIALAILLTTRANVEAQHGSKADSETATDIVSIVVDWLRQLVEASLDADLVRLLVEVNFGEESLDLAPFCKLSSVDKPDMAKTADSVAKLWASEFLHTSQVQGLDRMLGLPERDLDAWLNDREEASDQARVMSEQLGRLREPGVGGDPKVDEEEDEEEQKE